MSEVKHEPRPWNGGGRNRGVGNDEPPGRLRGKRFFNDGMDLTKFKLIESKPTSLGIVLLTYEMTKEPSKTKMKH